MVTKQKKVEPNQFYDTVIDTTAAGIIVVTGSPQNLQTYTPSALLLKGQVELKVFNNLYTQRAFFNQTMDRNMDGARSTYFGTFNNFLYGLSEKINLGFDLYIRAFRTGARDESPFSVLQFTNTDQSRVALAKFGPRIKFVPFKNIGRLSVQSTLLFPIAQDLEGKESGGVWLDWDTFTWLNQLFFDRNLSSKLQLFSALELFTRFPRNSYSETPIFTTPVKAFLSYFPNQKVTVYGMSEFGPTWGSGDNLISSYYTQVGVGGKYQLKSFLELETLFTIFPIGKNSGAGATLNLGVRYIR